MAKSLCVDEPRSVVERTVRQRRPKATHKSTKVKAPRQGARQKCRSLARPCQTRSRKDQTTSLPRPAQPQRRRDGRRAASGDRLATTQRARLPGWGCEEEARPHAPIGEARRWASPLSHCQRGLAAMPDAGLPEGKATGPTSRDLEVARRVEALCDLTPDELRKEWRRLYRTQPPRLSRDLLVRAIAYRIQELRYGGLSKATSRKFAALVRRVAQI